ncbi:MAG: MoaD/ThiS family protein [Desulfobacterales bacterium]|jgi:molybdopterin converting factor small subunit
MTKKLKINIRFCGPLAGYAGIEKAKIELSEKACFEDLLSEIGREYGPKMPQLIWDAARVRFTHHVLAVKGFRHLTDLNEPLNDEEEIKFFLIMVGG